MIWDGVRQRWLSSQLPRLVEAGLISSEQAEKIRAYYDNLQSEARRRFGQQVLATFVVLGVALWAASLAAWVAGHWDQLGDLGRLAILLAGWAAGYAILFSWKAWHRVWVAKEIGILGVAGLVPLVLAQLSFLYGVDLSDRDILFRWAVGLLPFLLAFRTETAGVLFSVVVALAFWGDSVVGLIGPGSPASGLSEQIRFFIFPLAWLLCAALYARQRGVVMFVLVGLLGAWLVALPNHWPLFHGPPLWQIWRATETASYCGMVGAWLVALGTALGNLGWLASCFVFWGLVFVWATIIPLGHLDIWLAEAYVNSPPFHPWAEAFWEVSLIGGLTVAFAAIVWGRRVWEGRILRLPRPAAIAPILSRVVGPAVFLACFSFLLVVDNLPDLGLSFVPYDRRVAGWFGAIVLTVAWIGFLLGKGYAGQNRIWTVACVLTFLSWVFTRLADAFGVDYREAALLFAASGIVLGAVPIFIWWVHRRGQLVAEEVAPAPDDPAPPADQSVAALHTFHKRISPRLWLVICAVWQAGVFGEFVAAQQLAFVGPTAVVEIPVLKRGSWPERQFFKGQYILLNLVVNEVPCAQVEGIGQILSQAAGRQPADELWAPGELESALRSVTGRTVYVALELAEDGLSLKRVYASFSRPRSGLFLRGKIVYGSLSGEAALGQVVRMSDCNVTVRYGFEKFFARQNELRAWIEAIQGGVVRAQIEVAQNGRARLRSLLQ
ncbi:MAG: GDYXXLXY domain-containing protein [Thermoguttaceae bacterium]|nr:GDYXXLXY domain-containing protein [Thermoguttaceae bacterium]MDW8079887.1 GDYXXLXY domain-containing protein [Thermoguttaceae bacterium]